MEDGRWKMEDGRWKEKTIPNARCSMLNAQYPTMRLARSHNLIPAHPKIDPNQPKIALSVGLIMELGKS